MPTCNDRKRKCKCNPNEMESASCKSNDGCSSIHYYFHSLPDSFRAHLSSDIRRNEGRNDAVIAISETVIAADSISRLRERFLTRIQTSLIGVLALLLTKKKQVPAGSIGIQSTRLPLTEKCNTESRLRIAPVFLSGKALSLARSLS